MSSVLYLKNNSMYINLSCRKNDARIENCNASFLTLLFSSKDNNCTYTHYCCWSYIKNTRWRHITIIYLFSSPLFFSPLLCQGLVRLLEFLWYTIHHVPLFSTWIHVTNKFEIYLTFPFLCII